MNETTAQGNPVISHQMKDLDATCASLAAAMTSFLVSSIRPNGGAFDEGNFLHEAGQSLDFAIRAALFLGAEMTIAEAVALGTGFDVATVSA